MNSAILLLPFLMSGFTAQAAVPATDSVPSVEVVLGEELILGLRDPFQPPSALKAKNSSKLTDLEILPLKDLKLNGVITGPKKTRAMVTTPGNKIFFVKVGDKVGLRDGKVTQILNDAIRVTEYYLNEKGQQVPDVQEIRLDGEIVSMSKREGE